MPPQNKFQLIIIGHALSRASLNYLRKIGPYRSYKVLFHIERFGKPFEAAYALFAELIQQGCDLSGRTPTIWQTAGSSTGAHILHTAWHRVTGEHMRILNLIRRGDSTYEPSPEMPVIELGDFHRKFPENLALVISQSQQECEAAAVDDGSECRGVLDMTAMSNDFRKLRALQFSQAGQQARIANDQATVRVVPA